MINVKNFLERPHYDGEKKYKFSTANYLRLMSAENIYTDPRWYKISDVEKNNWTLKTDAKFELLEEWQYQECLLTEFYNASQVEESEKYSVENKNLNEVPEFFYGDYAHGKFLISEKVFEKILNGLSKKF